VLREVLLQLTRGEIEKEVSQKGSTRKWWWNCCQGAGKRGLGFWPRYEKVSTHFGGGDKGKKGSGSLQTAREGLHRETVPIYEGIFHGSGRLQLGKILRKRRRGGEKVRSLVEGMEIIKGPAPRKGKKDKRSVDTGTAAQSHA